MDYDTLIKLLATNGDESRRFLLERTGAVGSQGCILYGYDPTENARNLLEDFGIDGQRTRSQEIGEAKNRIRFYVGDGWDIEVAQSP